jgi:predicted nucleic acid-binding Zn ribbon protein
MNLALYITIFCIYTSGVTADMDCDDKVNCDSISSIAKSELRMCPEKCYADKIMISPVNGCNYKNVSELSCGCFQTLVDDCFNTWCAKVFSELKEVYSSKCNILSNDSSKTRSIFSIIFLLGFIHILVVLI